MHFFRGEDFTLPIQNRLVGGPDKKKFIVDWDVEHPFMSEESVRETYHLNKKFTDHQRSRVRVVLVHRIVKF